MKYDNEGKIEAFNLLSDMVANEETEQDERESALTIIGIICDDGNDGTCNNHIADSWGACENCGNLVF